MALFRRLPLHVLSTEPAQVPHRPRRRPGGVRAGGPDRPSRGAAPASLDPAAVPRCFGPVPNFADSPLPGA